VLVLAVEPGSPAEAAGLLPMDLVVAANGRPTVLKGDLYRELGPVFDATKRLALTVFRPSGGTGVRLDILVQPQPSATEV
jgi:S1-C subfamily serine protease